MSTAPDNQFQQLLSDSRDLRYESRWRSYGSLRYYNQFFWESVTCSFNHRITDVLPPLSMLQLLNFMNSRRQLYYQMRAARREISVTFIHAHMHNSRNQSKRKRVEEEENSVESVMSTVPDNQFQQLLSDSRYFSFVDQMMRDLRYESRWRSYGPLRYYDHLFWESVTCSFNHRIADVLPPLSMLQLLNFMNSRRQLYYQMRAADDYTGDVGDAFRLCDECSNIAYFPTSFLGGGRSESGYQSGGSVRLRSGEGSGTKELVRQRRDAYMVLISDLYTQGAINAQVFAAAILTPAESWLVLEVMERDRLIPVLVAFSDLKNRRDTRQ